MTRNLHLWCHSIVHLFTFWSRYGILLYYWNVPINGQTVSNISKAVWISQMSTVHSNSICHSLFSDVIFTKEGIIWKSSLIETIICVTFQTHLQITGLVLLTVVNVKMRRVFNELLVLERTQDYLDYFFRLGYREICNSTQLKLYISRISVHGDANIWTMWSGTKHAYLGVECLKLNNKPRFVRCNKQ